MAELFDAYVMVDWSAAAVPRQGRDSIWICHLERRKGRLREVAISNPATRRLAERELLDLLAANRAAGRVTLVGFDFPFGYPAGFARKLGLRGPAWRAVWDLLAERLQDNDDNANDRFAVAAELNRRATGGAAPFWGCPNGKRWPCLAPTHHRRHAAIDLAEHRLADASLKGPQPVWKLYGNGSAGGQALTGIPVVRRLRDALGGAVWPFETGLAVPRERALVFAEIYPSLIPVAPAEGEVRDRAQVRAIGRAIARWDREGRLATLLAPTLSASDGNRVIEEEGWILGATGSPLHPAPNSSLAPRSGERVARAKPATGEGPVRTELEDLPLTPAPLPASGEREFSCEYLRDPAAIYRRSFELAAAATDLSRLPAELHALALRLVHAAGDPALVQDLRWSSGAVARGRAALAEGASILVDTEMTAAGVTRRRLPAQNPVLCLINDRRVPALAKRLGTTRAAAAVELWRPHLGGAVVAIGNAPTALFHLLEVVAVGAPRPALVLGFPVGFVGAAEAKAALAEGNLPFIALAGRRGGSALAAAAVNALAQESLA